MGPLLAHCLLAMTKQDDTDNQQQAEELAARGAADAAKEGSCEGFLQT